MVFLGDYIDRGPDSKGVVTYVLDLQKRNDLELVFLKGNHEDMFMAYLGLPGEHGDMFLYNGGAATLNSYGINSKNASLDEINDQIPRRHFEFFENLKAYFVMEPFLCVHAGIHPFKRWEDQTETELLWIRNEFIYNSHGLPYTVLFGHTPQPSVLFDLPYKVGLDTGLVFGNRLSCLEVTEKVLFQVTRGKKEFARTAVADKWK